MLHAIQFSVIEHIKGTTYEFNDNVIWMYEGVKLPKEAPYCTVEHLINGVRGLDKLQAYEASTYNFQVGVFTATHDDLIKLQEKVKKLLFKDIALYNTEGANPVLTDKTFKANVTGITPIHVSDISENKDKHRSYIDLTVFSLNKN